MELTIEQALRQGVEAHKEGKLQDAERIYRAILKTQPKHPDANHNLGVLAVKFNQLAVSLPYFKAALEANPKRRQYWLSYVNALVKSGQTDAARKAEAEAFMALGTTGEQLSKDAEACLRHGNTLQNNGDFNRAIESYQSALSIRPDYADAHFELGTALRDTGQLDRAEECFKQTLILNPGHAGAHTNLGRLLLYQGRLNQAQVFFERALSFDSDDPDAHNSLGNLMLSLGNSAKVFTHFERALHICLNTLEQSHEIRNILRIRDIFINSTRYLIFGNSPIPVRNNLVRALVVPWCRPALLSSVSCSLIKLRPEIDECITRSASAWPKRLSSRDLYGTSGLQMVTTDTLLCALLESVPVADIGLEKFLTMVRLDYLNNTTKSLDTHTDPVAHLGFHSALAQQCYINEYLFSLTISEIDKASALKNFLISSIDSGVQISANLLLTVATYFPLNSLPNANRLLRQEWPVTVNSVLRQQISEPIEELELSASIPKLTAIDDATSILVQQQYEENPYPRWVRTTSTRSPLSVRGFLMQRFPLSGFKPFDENTGIDILVAGCGTGQHPIETAWRFRDGRILAVDLSLASLLYAKRKTEEYCLASIEYALADILKIESLGRTFDVIEAGGVLHHLADPLDGWQALLSVLRPNGVMVVGLYSKTARHHIEKIRNIIVEKGYKPTAMDIRQLRQDLVCLSQKEDFGNTITSLDFYSTSACRDLLFHVQESRMTIDGIKDFLMINNLLFLGFELPREILQSYIYRFPDDPVATNLDQWQIFESENPDVFFGMYQFWIQKAG